MMFDKCVLSNSGQWLAYSEIYIQIPFEMTFQSSAHVTSSNTYVQGFVMGLIIGYYQLVDSIQVDYNNQNIISLQPFTNLFVNNKLLSYMIVDYLKKLDSSIGFNPDSAVAASYASASSASSDGKSNNVVNSATDLSYASQMKPYSAGLLK